MAAFVIVDVLATSDEKNMEQYRAGVVATVQKHGGRYVAIGGPFQVKEGSWRPTFPVIIEFPNLDAANRWYDSPEYQPLKALRHAGSRGNMVFIEGLK
jgi:uncharacterized protein (DUF1330 family)